ncbi:MAG: YIP1 family protein [Candidatus Izemoplasmatales bacterium]
MKTIKRIVITFVFGLVILFSFGLHTGKVAASSSTTYTYALDDNGHFVQTQDAYLPGQTITDLGLDGPTDIAIDQNDNLVIVDSGNARVIVFNPVSGSIELTIAYSEFVAPTGVYVVKEASTYVGLGDIYVADPSAGKVFHFDSLGNLVESFSKPVSVMYETSEFQPEQIAVDKAGIMYIISKGSSDGIIQLSNTGEFLGFFSSNQVVLSLTEQFQQLIYTDAQLENLGINLIPPVFTSVFIDQSGYVYSSSSGSNVDNIKKHNTQGTNMFSDIFEATTQLSDIYVDDQGIIYTADQLGFISVYTNDGEFIYSFGTINDVSVAGFFKSLAGIAVTDGGTIWTVDSGNSYLQSFNPTEYATTIYDAIENYNNTHYEEAIALWTEVLSLNQLSILAHNGIAKNYLLIEEYQLAADHFKIAGNRELYSEAYWEIRNIWLQQNLIIVIGLALLLTIIYFVTKAVDKKTAFLEPVRKMLGKVSNVKVINDVLYMKTVSRKFGDSFYYLKAKRKGSYLGAFIILAITFAAYMLFVAGKGFIFQYTDIKDIDLNSTILGFVVLIGLFILCSYLVTSIQDGEGTLGDIFKGFAYSMYPFILGCFFSTVFSYVATNNEVFILNLIFYIGLAWTFVLVFVSISEIQNYTFWQTIKSILLTILFVLVILLVISFVQMTIGQLFSFLEEFIKEAIRNVFN